MEKNKTMLIVAVVVIVIIAVMTVCWGIYGPGYDPAEFVYMQF